MAAETFNPMDQAREQAESAAFRIDRMLAEAVRRNTGIETGFFSGVSVQDIADVILSTLSAGAAPTNDLLKTDGISRSGAAPTEPGSDPAKPIRQALSYAESFISTQAGNRLVMEAYRALDRLAPLAPALPSGEVVNAKAAYRVLGDARHALACIGTVGNIDGHEVIRRGSVLEIVDRMRKQAFIGYGTPAPAEGGEVDTFLETLRHDLKTQDNAITSEPIFVVYQKRRVYVGACSTEVRDFATACFTRKAAEAYLEVNGHNLVKPYIYVESGFRNAEWIELRKRLMSASTSPQGEAEPPMGTRVCDKPGCLAPIIRHDSGARTCAEGHKPRWVAIDSQDDLLAQIAELEGRLGYPAGMAATLSTLRAQLTEKDRELEELRALIGVPPVGSHPDEWKPRAATWHQERRNWIQEVEHLQQELDSYSDTVGGLLRRICDIVKGQSTDGRMFSWHDLPELIQAKDRRIAELETRLPEGMKDCTIVFRECSKGHGRLVATNWIDPGCLFCRIAELEAAQAWRPIETAPKDGTPILLWVRVVNPEVKGYIIAVRAGGWAKMNGAGEPTYWMPLPPPPAEHPEGGEV